MFDIFMSTENTFPKQILKSEYLIIINIYFFRIVDIKDIKNEDKLCFLSLRGFFVDRSLISPFLMIPVILDNESQNLYDTTI